MSDFWTNRKKQEEEPVIEEPPKKPIAFLSNADGFMTDAIISTLEEDNFDVTSLKPKLLEVEANEITASTYLLYLDVESGSGFNNAIHYLRERCIENPGQYLIYLIGTPAEIDWAKDILSGEFVTGEFIRPFNVKDVIERLNSDIFKTRYVVKKKHILVIDDDPSYLSMLNKCLSKKYRIFQADSGMNGISLLARQHIDLILLDYQMPVISGAKVAEMLRSETATKNIPIMFLTAKADKGHVMTVRRFKPEKYLLKNLSGEQILAQIDEYFMKHPNITAEND